MVKPRKISPSFAPIIVIADTVGLSCPNCGDLLEIHQPDPGYPHRLLATCGHCLHWYLHDLPSGEVKVGRKTSSKGDPPSTPAASLREISGPTP